MVNRIKNKIIKMIKNPSYILYWLDKKKLIRLNDKKYLEILYKKAMGEELNLIEPIKFNEKLQWLKLYDRNPKYINLVDKYIVKEHISNVLGKEYVIPTLGIWNRFKDIEFDKLPNKFVLKCTHDSGSAVICKDKEKFDYKAAKKKIQKALKTNYYYLSREWPYKNIKPRIIAEEYMGENEQEGLKDYKFYCFNGKCNYVMLCTGREKGDTKFYYYDRNWNFRKEMSNDGKQVIGELNCKEPKNIKEMFRIVEKLSKGIKFVRIDLYNIKDKIYFGEFTFYPGGGFDKTRTLECETILNKEFKI